QSVGTDILVTRVAGTPTTTGSGATTSTTEPQRGFFGPGRGGNNALNVADTTALLNENSNVVTDLAKLGKPGDHFTRDFFLSATLLSFPQDAVSQVSKLPGGTSAVGGLVQLAEHQTGTVPNIVANIQTGGQTFTQPVRPAPMTAPERDAFRACLQAKAVQTG